VYIYNFIRIAAIIFSGISIKKPTIKSGYILFFVVLYFQSSSFEKISVGTIFFALSITLAFGCL
jgi:hypothetical protein